MGRNDYDCGTYGCTRTDYHEHNLDDHECPVDGCDSAYPHALLKDKHLVDEHPEYVNPDNKGATLTNYAL
jgi:hypothetical protein